MPEDNTSRRLPAALPWSSPDRCDGTNELASLPVEIYVMIFDDIQPLPQEVTVAEYKSTLAALCLVCRMFCAECQPRLFRSYWYNGQSMDTQLARKREVWHDMLKAGDPRSELLASFVREATYKDLLSLEDLMRPYLMAFLYRSLSTAATYFVNLDTLTLRGCILTSHVFLAVSRMQHLKTVALDRCTNEAPEMDVIQPRGSKWTSLTTTVTYDLELYIPTLVEFVDIERLTQLSSDDWRLITALLRNRTAPSLIDLRIETLAAETPHIPAILQNTPNLTRLSIDVDGWHGAAPLPTNVIPRLTALTADDAVVPYILPNHPSVTFLDISASHQLDPSANPFGETWKPWISGIRELAIVTTHLAEPHLQSDNLPQLRMLIIEPSCAYGRRNRESGILEFNRFAPQTPLLPPTTVVYNLHAECNARCANPSVSLKLRSQRTKLIPSMAAAFPNARCIRVGKVVEWRRVQGPDGVEDWEPRVYSRPLVRQMLLDDDQRRYHIKNVQDVDGCLASVLSEEELAQVRETVGFDDGFAKDA